MSDAEDIQSLANSLNEDITWTIEACEDLTAVPKMFRKMALKTILKSAKSDGVTEITSEYANKFKP